VFFMLIISMVNDRDIQTLKRMVKCRKFILYTNRKA
jgi:hypothetical protein